MRFLPGLARGILPCYCEGDDGGGGGGGEATSPVNADGTFVENWQDKFPEEHRETLKRSKNFPDFVDSHMRLRAKLGKNPDSMIELPTDKSSDAVRVAFHKARGVPDDVKGYEYKKDPNISAKVPVEDSEIEAFKTIAKKHNLTNKQLNGVMNDYMVSLGPGVDAIDKKIADDKEQASIEGNKVLAQRFKGEAETRRKDANILLDAYGMQTVKLPDGSEASIKGMMLAENQELLSSPWFVMFLDNVRGALSEDTLKNLKTTTTGGSPDQIKSKIAEIRSEMMKMERENPSRFRMDPHYKDLRLQKTELYKQSA